MTPKKANTANVCVLVSGGLDSTALLEFYREMHSNITGIHFQYGQPASESELRSVHRISSHYGIRTRVYDISIPLAVRGAEVIGRNALFVLSVAATLPEGCTKIALGIHSGTSYYDSNPKFVEDMQRLLDGYLAGEVTVQAPFLNFTKGDIYLLCKEKNVPVDLTYSCERQNDEPCGECLSCVERSSWENDKAR